VVNLPVPWPGAGGFKKLAFRHTLLKVACSHVVNLPVPWHGAGGVKKLACRHTLLMWPVVMW
jgi:hypothetical protein